MSAPVKSNKWLKLFESFVDDIRISSKEETGAEGGSKMQLWGSQRRFLHNVGEGLDQGIHKFNNLKGRQQGITTISIALVDVFWYALHPAIIGCLVTDDEKKREANRSLITRYVNSFPDGYFGDKFRIVKNNRSMIQYSNDARIDLLVAGTRDKGIGWAEGVGYSVAHLTEVSNYGSPEGVKSLEEGFAQHNPSRLYVYESTAKGFNHWYDRYMLGKTNYLTERSWFTGWWACETNALPRGTPLFEKYGRQPPTFEEKEKIEAVAANYGHRVTVEQLAWIRFKRDTAGSEQDLLDQNQPWTEKEAFVQAGVSFFPPRQLAETVNRIRDEGTVYKGYRYIVGPDFLDFGMELLDPENDDRSEIDLKVWDEPVPGGKYVIGCDGAYGRNDHKDATAIEVCRCYADRLVQVAEYCSNEHEPQHSAWVLFHLAAAYQDCMINIEVGGPQKLMMQEFDHLRQLLGSDLPRMVKAVQDRKWEDAAANARWYLYHRPDSPGAGFLYNFETTARTKQPLMFGMKANYYGRELVIRSIKLVDEMAITVNDDGEIGAPDSSDPDKKDDRVFATALACLAWRDWVRRDMIGQGMTYERVMAEEKDGKSSAGRVVHNIVYGFLQQQAELAENPPSPHPKWMEDNGLV